MTSYLETTYGLKTITAEYYASPYYDMKTYKPPSEDVLFHLSDIKKHIQTLETLYYPLDNCKASTERVSNWSVDVSTYLCVLSFAQPIDYDSFNTQDSLAKWLLERSRAWTLLTKMPNMSKLRAPGGRHAWDAATVKAWEIAKISLVESWQRLSTCYNLDVAKSFISQNISWSEWLKECDSLFLGDYVTFSNTYK